MRDQISSVELYYIVKELQQLVNSKVQKIYQPDKKSLLLELHLANIGKKMLSINEKSVYISELKPDMKEPPSFCRMLRKYLDNSRIRKIFQHSSQRIAVIEFEVYQDNKNSTYKLICEFFNKGNIIFTDKDNNIISPIQIQHFREREIRAKQIYEFPESKDVFNFKENEFLESLSSIKDSIGKALGKDFSLGRLYSDEVCHMAGIDNKRKCSDLSQSEINKI